MLKKTTKKVVKEEEPVHTPDEAPVRSEAYLNFEKYIENYKLTRPEKYETKKVELLKKLEIL